MVSSGRCAPSSSKPSTGRSHREHLTRDGVRHRRRMRPPTLTVLVLAAALGCRFRTIRPVESFDVEASRDGSSTADAASVADDHAASAAHAADRAGQRPPLDVGCVGHGRGTHRGHRVVSTTAGVRFRGEGIRCEFSQASRGSLPSRSSRAAATVLRCCSVGRGRTRARVATSSAWTARRSTSFRASRVPTRRRAPRPGRGAGRARSATTGSTTTATASRAPSSPARTARRGSAASGGAASGRTAAWAPERPDGGARARTRSDRPPRSAMDSTTTATAASTSRSVATTTSPVPGRGDPRVPDGRPLSASPLRGRGAMDHARRPLLLRAPRPTPGPKP